MNVWLKILYKYNCTSRKVKLLCRYQLRILSVILTVFDIIKKTLYSITRYYIFDW